MRDPFTSSLAGWSWFSVGDTLTGQETFFELLGKMITGSLQ